MLANFKIERSHLIVCEGTDDKEYISVFLCSILEHDFSVIEKNKDDINYFIDKFQIFSVNGVSKIPNFIKGLPVLADFNKIKAIIVICDSESEPQKTETSITSSLREKSLDKKHFVIPSGPCCFTKPEIDKGQHDIAIGYALFPNLIYPGDGALENLCIKTFSSPNFKLLELVDNTLETARKINNIDKFKRLHKNKLYTYLSLTDDFVGMKLGIAARHKAFNLSHIILDPLKNMLSQARDYDGEWIKEHDKVNYDLKS
jgi:hypothetical protein